MKKLWSIIKKNLGASVSIGVVIGLCILLIIRNYHNSDFLSANAVDVVSIFLGTIIVFYLTEHMNEKRRRNDCIEHIIMEIEDFVSDDDNFKPNKNTLMRQTYCANRIKYMRDASFRDIKEDILFIETHFEEIRDLYSNHNQNEDELTRVKIDIDRHRGLITDKCCKIRVGLYSI